MNLIEQIKVNDTSIDGYQGTYYTESPEYVQVTTDSDGKILEGIKSDGSKHIAGDLTVDGSLHIGSFNINQIVEDIQERVDEMLEPVEETLSYFEPIDNPEWLQVTIDNSGKILEGTKKDGTKYIASINIDIELEKRVVDLENKIVDAENDIEELKEYPLELKNIHLSALENVSLAKSKYSSYGTNGENTYISFLQMTDSHSDTTAIRRGFEIANTGYFDILLHTGDIIENTASFPLMNWKEKVLNSNVPVLTTPGNHAFLYAGDGTSYGCFSDEEVNNLLYDEELVAHNGETHPVINGQSKNYFYKDITKNGYTLRVISLFQFEWNSPVDEHGKPIYGELHGKDVAFYSQEQVDWFINLLENTPTNVPVLLLSHIPVSRYNVIDCGFSAPNSNDGSLNSWSFLSNKFFFFDIIDAFVNGTECTTASEQVTSDNVNTPISVNHTFTKKGNFIANICGHFHDGGLLWMKDRNGNNSPYRMIMSPCTSSFPGQNGGLWSRAEYRTKDCLNAFVYDYNLNKLQVIRIGSDISKVFKEAKYYTF